MYLHTASLGPDSSAQHSKALVLNLGCTKKLPEELYEILMPVASPRPMNSEYPPAWVLFYKFSRYSNVPLGSGARHLGLQEQKRNGAGSVSNEML